jgi:glycosidase
MPIFPSPSYHGYDVTDYEGVNPQYGTLADFERLLAEAHRRGIRVILDFVMNHSSDQHPWFVDSAASPGASKRDWYVWRAEDPGWTQPWGGSNPTWHERNGAFYYGVFWGGMPDLNFASPAVRAEMKRLAGLWLERGVDGFRLDATRHLFAGGPAALQNDRPETHAFLREFAAYVRSVRPDAVLVGENWTDTDSIAAYYGSTAAVAGGDELPMNFNFPLAAALVDAAARGDAAPVAAVLARMAEVYPAGILDAPFLTNHDMIRIATQVGGETGKLRVAAAALLTLPGAPFLYYGEEVGLANGPGRDDRQKRTPMPWDGGAGFSIAAPWFDCAPGREGANVALQTGDSASLLAHYRRWIGLRERLPALANGELRLLSDPRASSPLLLFERVEGGRRLLVAHNFGGAAATVTIEPGAAAIFLAGEGRARRSERGLELALPPYASAVFALD